MQRPSYIVFLCFGNEDFFYECAFALLSIARFHTGPVYPFVVRIYTSNPGWFGRFADCPIPLELIYIAEEQLTAWQGESGYLYRPKACLLQHLAEQENANWLYMDTDVVITFPLDVLLALIDEGELVLHQPEGTAESRSSPILRKLNKLFTSKALQNCYGHLQEMQSWNSGVVGFSSAHSGLLRNSVEFIDFAYALDKSIRTIEQVALSFSFSKKGTINAALPWVLHYWNLKEIRGVLEAFFKLHEGRNWAGLVQMATYLQPYALFLDRTRFSYNRTPSQIMAGKKWGPDIATLFPKGIVK